MDLDQKRTRVLSSIYRGYNYKQITETHDCNMLMVVNVCRAILKSTKNENTSTAHTRELLQRIAIDFNEEEYPELWI